MSHLSVAKSLETIADAQAIVVDSIGIAKAAQKGIMGWGAILAGVFQVAIDVKELAGDAPEALPELQDLEASEVAQLSAAAYSAVVAVVAALKA
jgi:hypothetical protein